MHAPLVAAKKVAAQLHHLWKRLFRKRSSPSFSSIFTSLLQAAACTFRRATSHKACA